MTRLLIRLELLAMFCFAVVAGACISDTVERRAHDTELMAISVVLTSMPLQQLGEISI
jgi:hypothetical protein